MFLVSGPQLSSVIALRNKHGTYLNGKPAVTSRAKGQPRYFRESNRKATYGPNSQLDGAHRVFAVIVWFGRIVVTIPADMEVRWKDEPRKEFLSGIKAHIRAPRLNNKGKYNAAYRQA